jgi:uncharacterized protein
VLLVDSGPLFAALDRTNVWHERCVELLGSAGRLVTTGQVVAETCMLAERRLRAPADAVPRFLAAIAAGEIAVVDPAPADLRRAAELIAEYRDLPLGIVDAGLVVLSEVLALDTIATLDRRHFAVVRPRHREALNLVPASI